MWKSNRQIFFNLFIHFFIFSSCFQISNVKAAGNATSCDKALFTDFLAKEGKQTYVFSSLCESIIKNLKVNPSNLLFILLK